MVCGLVACVLAATLANAGSVAAAAPVPPSQDPFYVWGKPLKSVAPGTVLRTRAVEVDLGTGSGQDYPAKQVLYRTTDQLGHASATVATIIAPTSGTGPLHLLSYQSFYDGLADTCRPSYTLQDGQSSGDTAGADESIMLSYLSQGFTVVTSDFEGPTDDFSAGREAGMGTLDGILAAEHDLGVVPQMTPVGLLGYSGGSIASEWASELAPTYAPELDLIGVAEGGIPVDFTHNINYIDGSSGWAGAIPAVLVGLARAYRVKLHQYLDAEGIQITDQVAQGCLDESADPGLTLADLLKPKYRQWQQVAIFVQMFNDSIMGRGAVPTEPLLLGVGDSDGTGDGVMIAGDVQQLAYQYCQQGVTTQFTVYSGDDHYQAIAPFDSQAMTFLQKAYGGSPATNSCASITSGNALVPLPEPSP